MRTTMRYHYTLRMAKIKAPNAGDDAERLYQSYTACENVKWHRHRESILTASYKIEYANITPPTIAFLGIYLSQRN